MKCLYDDKECEFAHWDETEAFECQAVDISQCRESEE